MEHQLLHDMKNRISSQAEAIKATTRRELDEVEADHKAVEAFRAQEAREFWEENKKTLLAQAAVAAGVSILVHVVLSHFHHRHHVRHHLF